MVHHERDVHLPFQIFGEPSANLRSKMSASNLVDADRVSGGRTHDVRDHLRATSSLWTRR